ncbi:MAG TPA: bile acid:sodium symporter family protein [Vicinamibacterales bacterium]|nr:bile acid:sodium symporter family protein [Vicinamibacterales bacterium]
MTAEGASFVAAMEFLNTRVVPLALILVMGGMGLSLTPADFRRVLLFPKAAAVGLTTELFGPPLLAFALGYLMAPSPAIAVGAVIVTACASGVTSNAYSFAARADVALCVTLSAITSIVTVFTVPLLTYLALQFFFERGQMPALPVAQMLRTLVTVTIIPVAVGMLVRALAPRFAERLLEPLRRMVMVLLIVVLSAAALSSYDVIRNNLATAGTLVVLMNLLTMAMGYGVARLARLPAAQAVTITYEVGVQNLALALLITLTILRSPDLAVPALLYAVVMPAVALAFLPVARRILEAEKIRPVQVG